MLVGDQQPSCVGASGLKSRGLCISPHCHGTWNTLNLGLDSQTVGIQPLPPS